jgi:hypothetical protein
MWRHLNGSVAGTSHDRSSLPCQDHCFTSEYSANGRPYLLLTCSDGAGSASHSQLGSKLACETVVNEVIATLETVSGLSDVDRPVAQRWYSRVRERLIQESLALSVSARELSCTLLVAVIGDEGAVYAQLGDGALVTRVGNADDVLRPVFWPQNGEYANTTYFTTDSRAEELMLFESTNVSPSAVAAFTDGIQSLALNYTTKVAHPPFFKPFFAGLEAAESPSDLQIPFMQFLASDQVNSRTDDDKTLIVAVRERSRDA